jgi:hypothetical protein
MPMARHALADDLAVEYVEDGEQGRHAVALVVVGHRPATAPPDRQSRLGAVECLDLRLLVDRQQGTTHFHPTRQFIVAGLNAVFAAASGRPELRRLMVQIDPKQPIMPSRADGRVD